MSIVEQAQAKLDEGKLDKSIIEAKWRLEKIKFLEEEIANLKSDLAKIEDGTFEFNSPSCNAVGYTYTTATGGISTLGGALRF